MTTVKIIYDSRQVLKGKGYRIYGKTNGESPATTIH